MLPRPARLASTLITLLFPFAAHSQLLVNGPKSPFSLGPQSGPNMVVTGDFNNDGLPDFATVNFFSSSVSVYVQNAGGTGFTPSAQINGLGTQATFLAVGDFNLDGNLDLAVDTGRNAAGLLYILLGDGHGNFAAGNPIAAGLGASNMVVGDFNGDNIPDIVLGTGSATALECMIFLGNGHGGFSAGTPIAVGIGGAGLAAADLNGDGKLDLVVTTYGSNNVGVLLGDGKGGFTATPGSGFSSGGVDPNTLVLADFNNDGKLDLALANQTGNTVTIFQGDGKGGFTALGSPIASGKQPTYVIASDLNGDGNLDLVVTNATDRNVSVFLGNGQGAFSAATGSPFAVGVFPQAVAAADFNNDGQPDLVVANSGSGTVNVLLNNMAFTYFVPRQLTFWAAAGQTAPDQIGVTDHASASNPVTFASFPPWLNLTGGCGGICVNATPTGLPAGTSSAVVRDIGPAANPKFAHPLNVALNVTNPSGTLAPASGSPFAAGNSPQAVATGDFNGDGNLDLALANNGDSTVTLLQGDGKGGFTKTGTLALAATPTGMVAGDFNHDGRLDLAVGGKSTVQVFFGNGAGGFAQAGPTLQAGPDIQSMATGDFNNDGVPDFLTLNRTAGNLTIFLSDGFGGFYTPPGGPYKLGTNPYYAAIGDFNGDGNADIAVVNQSSNNMNLLVGNGMGGFTAATGSPFTVAGGPSSIIAGDFNGDGKLDVATSNVNTNTVAVLLGDGNGGFSQASGSPFSSGGAFPIAIGTADFDGDGKPDLVVGNSNTDPSKNLFVFLGDGTGAFVQKGPFPGGSIGYGNLVTADFNRDGRPDAALSDYFGNNTTVLLSGTAASSVSLAASPQNSVAAGQQLTLTATLTATSPYGSSATGSVQFLDGNTVLGSGNLTGGGTATFNTSSLTGGSHQLTAMYSGDAHFATSTSAAVAETVMATATSTTLTASPQNSVTAGQQLTLTATVTASGAGASPTGSVQFLDGSTVLGTVNLSGGTATFMTSSLAVGAHQLTAAYSGDTHFSTSTSSAVSETVTAAATGTPGVVSGTPVASSGVTQSYTFQFSHTAGAQALGVVNVLINKVLDGRSACYIAYSVPDNVLYLVPDNGSGLLPGMVVNGSGSTSNSQCSISGAGTSASPNGNILTLTVLVTFLPPFGGNKVVYAAARDPQGNNTGWVITGVRGVPPAPSTFPIPVSMSPAASTASSEVVTFVYQDATDANNLQTMWALTNTAIDGRAACYVAYYAPGNQVFLYPDNGDGNSASSMTLTGNSTLSNSQCTVSASGSSYTKSGAQATLMLNLTFKPAFAGRKATWLAAQTLSLQTSDWQSLGARTVGGN